MKRNYRTVLVALMSLSMGTSLLAKDAPKKAAKKAPNKAIKQQAATPVAARAVSREKNHDGKWWIGKHNAILKRVKQGKVDLVMLGDSLTDGWAWSNAGQPIWKKHYGARNAVNMGISGDRTEHVIWRLRHGTVDGISPKLVVLMIGTNNTGAKHKPEDTAAGIKVILDELRTRLPKTKILLLAVFPRAWNPNDPMRKANAAINKIIKSYADDKTIFFQDVGSRFINKQGTWHGGITGDCVHINRNGYRIWAEAMEPTIKKLMDEK